MNFQKRLKQLRKKRHKYLNKLSEKVTYMHNVLARVNEKPKKKILILFQISNDVT